MAEVTSTAAVAMVVAGTLSTADEDVAEVLPSADEAVTIVISTTDRQKRP